jgi:DNA-binding MarR family transcriptional regulator
MKLSPDIARDILLFLEKYLTIDTNFKYNTVTVDYLTRYSSFTDADSSDIAYTILKLSEAGFIKTKMPSDNNPRFMSISSITYQGHEFLDSIRNEEHYSKAKDICSKLGSFSLDILKTTAKSVIVSAINNNIN